MSSESDVIFDGCTAAAHVAYVNSDASFIYPITPSTLMAETADLWAHQGKKNIFGQITVIKQMQSEGGAAGAVHGSLIVGCLTTTFTASQGLLLMVPNMYKIAGELTPCVFHVSARAIATQALSIFGDHSDVMAVRQCGWAILASSNVQEAMDLAQIAHMTTLKARVPFLHFFDGFRTSHELQKIKLLDVDTIRKLIDHEKVEEFRNRGLNPTKPHLIGTSQGPDVYFQNVEAANKFYDKVPELINESMKLFYETTGRSYSPFSYFGDEEATDVIVIMGAGSPVCQEVVKYYMNQKNYKDSLIRVGMLTVHLFRPWCLPFFLNTLPKTVTRIAVLDRVKESGALGEPLYLDVAATLQIGRRQNVLVVGGRYGLGSKEFTPAMCLAVYENLRSSKPKEKFTVGILDDVTNLSLPFNLYQNIHTVPEKTTQCMFWGFGSDGTVSANKNVIKIIGDNTSLYVQGYFAYSAHKAGGITVSHLRFGPNPITSQYLIQQADYLACHRDAYVKTFDMLSYLKPKGVFVLNCPWTDVELENNLPIKMRKDIAKKELQFYTIDANRVALETKMGRRINNILMTLFFRLSGVLPFEEAISLFKHVIEKTYSKKGKEVVEANWKAVDAALNLYHYVNYDKNKWSQLKVEDGKKPILIKKNNKYYTKTNNNNSNNNNNDDNKDNNDNTCYNDNYYDENTYNTSDFVNTILLPLEKLEGNNLPISALTPFVGGRLPMGTAAYEKRGIAINIPIVNMELCTQCNYCSYVCPHAAIRPFLIDEDDSEIAPKQFIMKKTKGSDNEIAQFKYRIQVSPLDCTGCELCSIVCPANCLEMTPLDSVCDVETDNWNFAINLNSQEDLCSNIRTTLKGSQFYTPLMEFSGACEGCGETPYVKLLTQLFGERMIIANATGCSSIWGASYPSNPYTINQKGYGPAWGNSLFEDNAEYGYGMVIALAHRRERFYSIIVDFLKEVENNTIVLSNNMTVDDLDPFLLEGLKQYKEHWLDSPQLCQELYEKLNEPLKKSKKFHPSLDFIYKEKQMFPKFSHWIIGGDGWAYDIGYGGLDHVIATGIDINILILDTEVYSNTGGQTSKATPIGAVHKFSASGNMKNKKDLGMLCMQYNNVYVASVASSANLTQTIRAFVEAEKYYGPSLILAYAPCIEHGYIKPFSAQITHCTMAVESGYWPLYRFNPNLLNKGLIPLQLDSKKLKISVRDMLERENRFEQLRRSNPTLAKTVENQTVEWIEQRFNILKIKAEGRDIMTPQDLMITSGKETLRHIHILYGSETGNAEDVAIRIGQLIRQRGLKASVLQLSEIDLDELIDIEHLIVVISTAGQGEFPVNAKKLYQDLLNKIPETNSTQLSNENKLLSKLHYAVFGLGDSSYIFFNEAAKKYDSIFSELGAHRLLLCGLGDDQDDEKFDTALSEWLPLYWTEANIPEPLEQLNDDPSPSLYTVEILSGSSTNKLIYKQCIPLGTVLAKLCVNKRITPVDYDVDVRHLEFDLTQCKLRYALGDSLAIYPHTDNEIVEEFCKYFKLNPQQWIQMKLSLTEEKSAKHEALFKQPMTVKQLLTECLDLTAKPNRRFYEILYKYCTDPDEKIACKQLLNQKETLVMYSTKEYVNCFDVIKKFPSITSESLTLSRMIDLLPLHKPRYYSIASSQKFVGLNRLDLCVGIVDWVTSHGIKRFGNCTGYIRKLIPSISSVSGDENTITNSLVACGIKPTAFNMPPNDTYPIIMCGMGTGLAPFRSFIQYRAYLKQNGKSIGPVVLYFGCRYSKKDYLYGDELQQYVKDGVISDLKVAFSRDQKEKFYIQHHIDKDPELLCKRLISEEGYFYLCGSAKQVPIDIRAAVIRAITKIFNKKEEEADKMITDMQIKGQYNVEAW